MIATARLDLVPMSIAHCQAAIAGSDALAAALGVRVPPSWPPELLDTHALQWVIDRLRERPEEADWLFYLALLRGENGERTVIGGVGYKGLPTADGDIEIGYGILTDYRRRGFASEASQALIDRAFTLPTVKRVLIETFPNLAPSIGVATKCGFRLVGPGSEPGVIRFERARPQFDSAIGASTSSSSMAG